MSDKPNDGGPAFPKTGNYNEMAPSECDSLDADGMTLRDYFAASAISPMLVQAYGTTPGVLAERAYEIADAMIAARTQ